MSIQSQDTYANATTLLTALGSGATVGPNIVASTLTLNPGSPAYAVTCPTVLTSTIYASDNIYATYLGINPVGQGAQRNFIAMDSTANITWVAGPTTVSTLTASTINGVPWAVFASTFGIP